MKILITGASSGIGRDMARYLATQGHELILVARRKERLDKLKDELSNVKVTVVSLDLSKENNVYKLYDRFKDDNIDFLINNAGFGLFGLFHETDLDTELKMIDLNVCSSAGFMAGPRLNTYYATKNYITKLTMAINEELRQMRSNVVISALCPGPVSTEFNEVAHGKFSVKEANSQMVAKYAIDKTMERKMIIIPTLRMKLAIFGTRFIPYRLQLILAYHIQKRKEYKKK